MAINEDHPIVHLNGTSPERLLESLSDFYDALNTAMDKLRECAPNGRDYYPEPGRMQRAEEKHANRGLAIRTLMASVEREMDAISGQVASKD